MRSIEQHSGVRRVKRRKKRRFKRFAAFCMFLVALMLGAAWISGYPAVRSDYDGLQIAYNRTAMWRSTHSIRYIVIHETANQNAGANARQHFRFFNSGNQRSSADFFVDSTETLQINDYYRYYTWHCGDGGIGAKINNRNSVGVEICVNSDGDYEAALKRAAWLTKQLMTELNIGIDRVVRHRDASGKECPRSMTEDDWRSFKEMVMTE